MTSQYFSEENCQLGFSEHHNQDLYYIDDIHQQ